MIRAASLAVALAILVCGTGHAAFLDLTSLTSGSAGSFTGTLGSVNVTGTLVTTTTSGGTYYQWNAAAATITSYDQSVINNTSPQYSYSNIYSPSAALADQVGYDQFGGATGTATVTLVFSSAVTNLVFDVANLDSTIDDFSATAGLTGLLLLSGNGGTDGDGLAISGKSVLDANPNTLVGQPVTQAPLTSGARSAYGSVELLGTYTSVTFNVNLATANGDGGSFTFSTVPEPTSLAMCGIAGVVGLVVARLRRRRAA